MADERDALRIEMRRIREAAQAAPIPARTAAEVLGEPRPTAPAHASATPPAPSATPLPPPPDGVPVSQTWDVRPALPGGRLLGRLLRRVLAPVVEAQTSFNSRQVQLDARILEYLAARFEATHRHYDGVLGIHGRHMEEIDQRHVQLQQDLVGHVHDLVQRIDLTLEQGERTRVSLEAALRELRARLLELESRLVEK